MRAHGDGAVVLLHTWPGGTGEGIAPMIDGLREIGATFVSIDELETCRDQTAAILAVDAGGSKIDVALLRA